MITAAHRASPSPGSGGAPCIQRAPCILSWWSLDSILDGCKGSGARKGSPGRSSYPIRIGGARRVWGRSLEQWTVAFFDPPSSTQFTVLT
jgi:hypothetical protein